MDNFESFEDAWVWRYKANIKHLVEHNANPADLAVKFGRLPGMKLIPVVRMNDPHDQYYKYEVSSFKLENPHLLIGAKTGYIDWEKGVWGHPEPQSLESFTWGLFDFSHKEVREHKLKIIEEFIGYEGIDGISLDFERNPWFFAEEGIKENTELITGMIRDVRRNLEKEAEKKGRPQYLHVRVLPDPDVSFRRGLDVSTWVKEGFVDAITPGCGYMTFLQNLGKWMRMVEGHDCWIYPSNNNWKSPEVTRAWAKYMYFQGAHGLNLFNWDHMIYGFEKDSSFFEERKRIAYYDKLHPCYYEVLNQIGEASKIIYRDATYVLDSMPHKMMKFENGALKRKFRAIEDIELPIEMVQGGNYTLKLPFAEDITGALNAGFTPRICLRIRITNFTFPDRFDVCINGNVLDSQTRITNAVGIMNNDSWIEYGVDADQLQSGINELKVRVDFLNKDICVSPVIQNVELIVRY